MSRFFGEIRQLGYVVPDIEAAMGHWSSKLGVAPWYPATPRGAVAARAGAGVDGSVQSRRRGQFRVCVSTRPWRRRLLMQPYSVQRKQSRHVFVEPFSNQIKVMRVYFNTNAVATPFRRRQCRGARPHERIKHGVADK